MPSTSRISVVLLIVGMALAALAGVNNLGAALLVWLAQPLLALGMSWRRGSRAGVPAAAWPREAAPLLAVWAVGFAACALLLIWPLAALRDSGSLAAALALSVTTSLLLLALWRTWPMWHALERENAATGQPWHAPAMPALGAWRGLGVAVLVGLILGGGLLLAWPGLLGQARWPFALGYALLLPLLHWGIQRVMPLATVSPFDPFAPDEQPASDPEYRFSGDLQAQLYEAARGGRIDRALQLLQAGADPKAMPPAGTRDQRALPILAAVLPDLRLLRELIARGTDLNDTAHGMTPLLAATRDSWHGRPEAVMMLLANGADPRIADADGNTPLHHAARSSDPGVAALLLDAAAALDALNHEGVAPLGIACAAGNWRLAKFLLERGAKTEPTEGQPALLAAASTEEDDPAGVQLLLKHKARIDARDRQRRCALHEAASAGHADIAAVLLAAGANLEARDAQARTPWLEAARAGHAGVLEILLPHQPDMAAVDQEGRNALMLACAAESSSPGMVRRLLELGGVAGQADSAGKQAVDVAAEAGRWSMVSMLDADYPLPVTVGNAGGEAEGEATPAIPADRAPLMLLRDGLQSRQYDGLPTLLPSLARLCSSQELGRLLHDPQLAQRGESVEWLLSQGAVAEMPNADGDTPMFAMLAHGGEAVAGAQALLRRGVSPGGRGGLARFLAACARNDYASRGLEQFALDLLDHGADPFAASPIGDPPLSLAVRLGWLRLQKRVLDIGVDCEARDSHGMTALHLAAALERESALRQLVLHGASPEARAADGQTPLGVALAIGRRDLADWLDWRGWALPRRALRNADLAAAAMSGDADAVRRLLDLGLPVDAVDAQGCSALLRAAGGGHAAAVDVLLARGADPQQAAHSGATPLSAAVSMRQAGIVSVLLNAGAQIEYRLPGGVTVLMLASALGMPDVAARLLAAGADIHACDTQGLSALHCAAHYGFTCRDQPRLMALLDELLLAGATADRDAAGGITPLLLLLGARAEPGTVCDEEVVLASLERLLDEDVSLEVQDPRGFGPLHLAALHGLPSVVRRLLRVGADPTLRDKLNRIPREIALMRGFIDVAAEFTMTSTPAPMSRFLREPHD